MIELEMLKRLIYEANVQTNVLAQFCNCSPASLTNYIRGTYLPNGSRLMAIREGLKKYKEMIDNIIRE